MSELQPRANAVVLGGLGLILGLILLRFLVTLGGISAESVFTQLIIGITDPLVNPFNNIYRLAQVGSFVFDIAALISFFVTLVIGVLFHDIVLITFQEDQKQITSGLVNILFKYIEFFYIARIILKLLDVTAIQGSFSATVYSLTNWSAYIFPPTTLFNGVVEVSTVIFLIVFVLIDVFTERVVAEGVITRFLDRLISISDKLNLGFLKISMPKLPKPTTNSSLQSIEINPLAPTTPEASVPITAPVEVQPQPVAAAIPTVEPVSPTVAPNAFSNAVLEVEEIQNVQKGK